VNNHPIKYDDLHNYYSEIIYLTNEFYLEYLYLPQRNEMDAFCEHRKDRIHCGIDIYAMVNSPVHSTLTGFVIDRGKFTSNDICDYWNNTYFLVVENKQESVALKYAELSDVTVNIGDYI